MTKLNSASCRVAFAAMIHDLGKLAERGKLSISKEQLNSHKTLYCPFNQEGQYHSHIHSAYTGFAIDQIEHLLPDLISQNTIPFVSRGDQKGIEITDSIINAAAAHHKPDSFLQWIIATADRVASGFERDTFEKYNRADSGKNHYQARLLSLFEQISLNSDRKVETHRDLKKVYPLKPLSPESIFPIDVEVTPKENEQAQAEYLALWNEFCKGLEKIPSSHKKQWDLWLDHFDTAYQCFASCIPSATAFGVKPEVSLYDHSKATAALATALWRWHNDNNLVDETQITELKNRDKSWNKNKFLLIQGDFFGIQDFIFSGGSESNKQAAKLLRGRSFQVSLFTELAALKVLQKLALPSTSQILNAAGKFLIVAPNTEQVHQTLDEVKQEINQWFIDNTFGLAGLGIATQEASCNDFLIGNFSQLQKKLFEQLETVKLQRFDLAQLEKNVQNINYPYGCCELNQYFPAESETNKRALISQDQINIGKFLVEKDRLIICDSDTEITDDMRTQSLKLSIFGYKVIFTSDEEHSGKFGKFDIHRFWDFSLPKDLKTSVWNGYARRYINGYVMTFSGIEKSEKELGKYPNVDEVIVKGNVKTFDYLACEDRIFDSQMVQYIGQPALMTLKGDVDNLGLIFQKGLENATFAKMTTLSRQMNQFFSLWLPAYCNENKANIYTVFAGGDDFFLIGSWHSTQKIVFEMQKQFKKYVADNEEIHFSAGMVMTKVGYPVPRLGELAEETLEKSKAEAGKNAVTIFDSSISWNAWENLIKLEEEIERLAKDYNISTSYLYSLINLSKQAELAKIDKNLTATMWRSHFYYKTARYVIDKLKKEEKEQALKYITCSLGNNGIEKYGQCFQIPLFNYFYKRR